MSYIDTPKCLLHSVAINCGKLGGTVETESTGLGSQLNVKGEEKDSNILKVEPEKLGGE